jgi:ABC-type bacteriocin/lantibiotic exporter with double-glycine peptidase domain
MKASVTVLLLTVVAHLGAVAVGYAGQQRLPSRLRLEREWQSPQACGVNSLFLLLQANDIAVDHGELYNYLSPKEGLGNSLRELQDAANRWGLRTYVMQANDDDILNLGLPFVAHLNAPNRPTGHFCVVYSMNRDTARILDGTTGIIIDVDATRFFRRWTGYVLATGTTRLERVLELVVAWEALFLITALLLLKLRRPRSSGWI